ncbi:Gfo/Idh/MocA family protein [Hoeflea ulvae]|uniref:Gfo/Idh/MocA family oxidoreductase n=1 Tax=Hoeflea ulvae TaxID=2983764 RepID=A0ABT3YHN1_9HYPH|nr:Gfo/Idh/MocA family oxidoreductase [Hoeflea ulvae]MCY0095391.1 Gfo/Idh/MocA family oxidoreductase [Hoeflea ulvae]
MSGTLDFAVLGLDHRHAYGMSEGMIAAGARMCGYWTDGEPVPLPGFRRRFPDAPRITELDRILEDDSIRLVLIACAPEHRAEVAIKAMRCGKDVMVDKPGCLTLAELEAVETAVKETGRIWSINFSERFEVRATTVATELVQAGVIGEVVQTMSLAPHRLNIATRLDWFFEPARYGGILGDIGTHQIDQFLHFAGREGADVVHAAVGNFANPGKPQFEDFGEMALVNARAQGYVRLDWYTPDALPNWGDGRLFILGTEGNIELRKYVDVAGREGTDHLFVVNRTRCEHIDCSSADLPYFSQLAADIRDRTETACSQNHTFQVCRLALKAQTMAVRRGNLA